MGIQQGIPSLRGAFSHDYPDGPELQAEMLNQAFQITGHLLAILELAKRFVDSYLRF